jgi:glycosyl transferase family 87
VLILKFILAVFENQAYDSLALVCIVFGIFELVRGRTVLASASLATAAALKITPLIFLPYLLLKRRYVGAAVFVVVVVFLTLLPDILEPPKQSRHVTTWMREVVLGPFFSDPHDIALQFWVATTTLNQSFRGAVARIVGEMNHPEQFTIVLRIVSGVYLAGIGLLLLRSMRSD